MRSADSGPSPEYETAVGPSISSIAARALPAGAVPRCRVCMFSSGLSTVVGLRSERICRSDVNVAYRLTGLSPAGNADLETSISESNYAGIMEQWRTMINNSRETIDEHFGR